MKRKVLTSIVASTVLVGAMVISGCGSNSSTPVAGGSNAGGSNAGGSNAGGSNTGGSNTPGVSRNGMVNIATATGSQQVDPATGGTVVVNRNSDTVAKVLHAELNKCANADTLGTGVACGPKKGVTYIFQSDFGKLNGLNPETNGTYNGGALLFDALTQYTDPSTGETQTYNTPNDTAGESNRLSEVYIPSNYIMLTDMAKQKTKAEQYDMMLSYLNEVCNMKCLYAENQNNPYFDMNTSSPTYKPSGRFVATYVMQFTRGTGEKTLNEEFAKGDVSDLEYLTVSFELDVNKATGGLQFVSPAGSKIYFSGKKAGQGGFSAVAENHELNLFLHPTGDDADNMPTVNLMKYFNKYLVSQTGALDVTHQYAAMEMVRDMLVENLQHPWPIKVYGSLHEIKDPAGTAPTHFDKAFIRNPSTFDASLYNLDLPANPYAGAFTGEDNRITPAQKINIVYPGGDYNTL